MTGRSEGFITAFLEHDEDTCIESVSKRIKTGEKPSAILDDIREATANAGQKFESGEYSVADLMMAGENLNQVMEVLKPAFGENKPESRGKIVIGTVEGDIHDIGKNIVVVLLEAEGFEVIDLGVNQPPEVFIDAIKEHRPIVVSLSGLLTEAIHSMKITIDEICRAGLRNDVKIIIGGGRTNEEAREYTGADDWADDAISGIRKIKKLAETE